MIDREKVLHALEHCDLGSDMPNCPGCAYLREPDCGEHLKRDIIALLKAQEPVVHGRWVISPGCLWPIGDCSVCGEQHIGTNSAKYCPNCGAKMDLEIDH